MNSPGQYMPNMLLEKSEEITPETMTRQSQSEHSNQVWMWQMMEIKSDTIKGNIA